MAGSRTKAPANKTRARAKKRPKAQATTLNASTAFLEAVKAENPNITSEQFALKFNLPLEEVFRHRGFIHEYVKDFDAGAAAMRLGYPSDGAGDIGRRFLHYPYAQLYLSELLKSASVESLVTVGEVVARLRKEMNNEDSVCGMTYINNGGNRIKAAATLGKALGMFTPKQAPVSPVRPIMVIGNVTLADPENWGEAARQSQKKLKASTVVDV
jgi:hypothetical protein